MAKLQQATKVRAMFQAPISISLSKEQDCSLLNVGGLSVPNEDFDDVGGKWRPT